MTSLLIKTILFAKALEKIHTQMKKKHKLKKKKPITIKPTVTRCRICNQEKGDIPIFNNKMQPEIPEEIARFSGVLINNTDHSSKYMCQGCLDLLNGCIKFRKMCQKNNQIMIQMPIKREYQSESDDSYNIPSPTFSDEHTEIRDCPTCNKQFNDLVAYYSHLTKCEKGPETQQPEKRFLCDVCGKTAQCNAHLLSHMAVHDDTFRFKCDVCPYRGRTMGLLKVHQRIHLPEKPYKCTLCPKTTTSASNLKKHMRHVHSTSRVYKCTLCDKTFSYQQGMKRHMEDTHLRQGTVECDVCKKKFHTKRILQGHRWKVHKIKAQNRLGRMPAYLMQQIKPN